MMSFMSKISPGKCKKSHLRESAFQNFPGEHALALPPERPTPSRSHDAPPQNNDLGYATVNEGIISNYTILRIHCTGLSHSRKSL